MVLYVSTSKYSRTFQNYNEKLGQAQKLSVLLQPGTTAPPPRTVSSEHWYANH